MEDEYEYLAPEFFTRFGCKMGKCRKACCTGWPISFSVEDYFLLMGMECDEEMRHRLDRGVKVALSPTEEHYAQIMPRYDGDCYMRLEDGRCAIQAAFGEKALPRVCRLYPRGVRCIPKPECAPANSCERVIELLFEEKAPISFKHIKLPIAPPKGEKRLVSFPTMGKEQEIRLWLIEVLQGDGRDVSGNIISLGYALKELDCVLAAEDDEALTALLKRKSFLPNTLPRPDLAYGLGTAKRLLCWLDDRSESLHDYGQEAINFYAAAADESAHYLQAAATFESRFPDWRLFTENMMANHLFFEQFPYQDRPETPYHEFLAVCALYAVLRLVCIGCTANDPRKEKLVDVCAAAFRLVEHTSFSTYAAHELEAIGCTTPEKAVNLAFL